MQTLLKGSNILFNSRTNNGIPLCSQIILLKMSSKIKAAIRIRPFLKNEAQNGYKNTNIRSNKSKGEV
jgi:hypothetical protein